MPRKRRYPLASIYDKQQASDDLTDDLYRNMPADTRPAVVAENIRRKLAADRKKKNGSISEADPEFGKLKDVDPDKGRLIESRLDTMRRRKY